MSLKILIVDDEPKVYQGLKRLLWTEQSTWDVHYATDGTQGLALLSGSPIDVIISDYKMPLMDGSAFLTHVATKYPQVIRIVLSGECDRCAAMDLVQTAHLFLSKPTDSKRLIDFIERGIRLKDILHNPDIAKVLTGMKTIPSLGDTFIKLDRLLNNENTHVNQLVEIISEDPSLIAKILQISNSAFFNVHWNVTNLTQAINVIGYDVLKSLVLTHGLMRQSSINKVGTLNLKQVADESVQVALLARQLAQCTTKDAKLAEDAFISAVLSKVGVIITAQSFENQMRKIIALAAEKDITYDQAEREVFGCNHAEICAFLLAIWGLPASIIEAVGFHLKPSNSSACKELPLLQCTHAASAFFRSSSKLVPNIHAVKDSEILSDPECVEKWETFENIYKTFKEETQPKSA